MSNQYSDELLMLAEEVRAADEQIKATRPFKDATAQGMIAYEVAFERWSMANSGFKALMRKEAFGK